MRRGARAERIDGVLARAAIGQRRGEGPADVVGALGWASKEQPAGRELKHLRASLTDLHLASEVRRAAKFRPAIHALETELLAGRDTAWCHIIPGVDRMILIYIALLEWLSPHCGTCHGARALTPPGMERIECAECAGSGRRRYSDREREERFGQALTLDHQRLVAATHGEIAQVDMLATEGVARKLR